MKTLILYFNFLLLPNLLLGQTLPDLKGDIVISIIPHSYLKNKKDELTKKTSNGKNNPLRIYYLNSKGELQFEQAITIIYGYVYDITSKLMRINIWHTKISYLYDEKYDYYEKYEYNEKGNKLRNTRCLMKNDSIIGSTNYWYDNNGKYQGEYFSPSYYYERAYDSLNRIKILRQIYNSKIRWEWNYFYNDSCRIGEYSTFDQKGKVYKVYKVKEIRKYRNNKLIEVEEFNMFKEGLSELKKYSYSSNGLLKRIDNFRSHSYEEKYLLEDYTDIKYKIRLITKEAIDKINSEIINADLILYGE